MTTWRHFAQFLLAATELSPHPKFSEAGATLEVRPQLKIQEHCTELSMRSTQQSGHPLERHHGPYQFNQTIFQLGLELRLICVTYASQIFLFRRKDRRFENDNMLGLRRILNQNGVEASEDMNEEADFINSRAKFGLMVNWRSMFSELFTDENMEIRENFRTCSNVLTSRARSKNCIPIRKDQWAQAEIAWYQIEHRLRAVVVRSFEKEEFCLFVQALEAVLLFFLSQGKAPASHLIPEALSVQLEVPLDVSDSSLSIVLRNSSFHRLLLHAACQFYGLRSKVNYFAFNYLHDFFSTTN